MSTYTLCALSIGRRDNLSNQPSWRPRFSCKTIPTWCFDSVKGCSLSVLWKGCSVAQKMEVESDANSHPSVERHLEDSVSGPNHRLHSAISRAQLIVIYFKTLFRFNCGGRGCLGDRCASTGFSRNRPILFEYEHRL